MITKMGMPFGGLKKAGFTGSYQGMRFFVKAFEEDTITAFVYPEPNSFDNTDDADKQSKKFPYTHEGVDECIDWLNETYEAQKEKWDNALTNKNNDR